MISNRPYLIRALNEWILDSGFTPHVLINADIEGVEVPATYIEDGKIVMNISPDATRELTIGNDSLIFSARFNGTPRTIEIPIHAVVAIYARENGQGMIFTEEDGHIEPESPASKESAKPHLKIVK